MKKLLIIILSIILSFQLSGQKLLNIYKSGNVVLTPDPDYGQNNDWDVVFKTYYDTIYNKPMGERKSLKLMPDGSVVVNHEYRDFFSKFLPNGAFEKEFSINGKVGVQKKYSFEILGINDNTFYTDLDQLGNMLVLDFDGNYKRKLKLDYAGKQMITLSDKKIAVVGWVLWSEKIRHFVSIVEYETSEQHDIWERFDDKNYPKNAGQRKMFHYSYKLPEGGIIGGSTMPFSDGSRMEFAPQIAKVDNKLMIAVPMSGEIFMYDLQGNLVSKEQIDWTPSYISIEEQKEIQRKAIEKYKNPEFTYRADNGVAREAQEKWHADLKLAYEHMIPQMEEDLRNISKPLSKPYFSTIIKDSDDNVLFFEYPKEEGQNKFNVWVYQDDGEFVCQSSFQCDDYYLQINPSKMVFHNGYLYGLQNLKATDGVPLRLVRFKLSSGN